MKNNPLIPATLCAFLLVAATHADSNWITLFNGKDLAGWRGTLNDGSFTVKDSTLRAHARSKTLDHLLYVGDQSEGFIPFKNFELELMARGEPNSNSGIFIHTDLDTRSDRLFLDSGYEIQLNSTEKEKRKTGSLYDVVDLDESTVDETQWFKVNIQVINKQITVKINDKQVIDYTEPENPERSDKRKGRILNPKGGAIALQAHDPDSIFYFKDIRIRRLP